MSLHEQARRAADTSRFISIEKITGMEVVIKLIMDHYLKMTNSSVEREWNEILKHEIGQRLMS